MYLNYLTFALGILIGSFSYSQNFSDTIYYNSGKVEVGQIYKVNKFSIRYYKANTKGEVKKIFVRKGFLSSYTIGKEGNDELEGFKPKKFLKCVIYGKKTKRIKEDATVTLWALSKKISGKLKVFENEVEVNDVRIIVEDIDAIRVHRRAVGYTFAGVFATLGVVLAIETSGGWGEQFIVNPVSAIITASWVKFAEGRKFRTHKGWRFITINE